MSMLSRLGEKRSVRLDDPNPPMWLKNTFGGGGVSVASAMSLPAVQSAVSQIAGSIAVMPMQLFRETPDGRKKATDHRSWRLLHDLPNPEMASDEFWEIVESQLLLWGNSFVYKVYGRNGVDVAALWPLRPTRVKVRSHDDGSRTYILDGITEVTRKHILHFRAMSPDGIVGYSPIQMARLSLESQIAQERAGAEFHKAGGRPKVIIQHPQKLTNEAAEKLRDSWAAAKTGGAFVLEEGAKADPWTMPLRDAQFVEQQQLGDLRVAQMFNLPPSRVGAKTGDSLTYTTTESAQIEFHQRTLLRWCVRLENTVGRDPDLIRDPHIKLKLLVDALLRATTKERYDAYATGIDAGFLSTDEVRDRENLPRRAGNANANEE